MYVCPNCRNRDLEEIVKDNPIPTEKYKCRTCGLIWDKEDLEE